MVADGAISPRGRSGSLLRFVRVPFESSHHHPHQQGEEEQDQGEEKDLCAIGHTGDQCKDHEEDQGAGGEMRVRFMGVAFPPPRSTSCRSIPNRRSTSTQGQYTTGLRRNVPDHVWNGPPWWPWCKDLGAARRDDHLHEVLLGATPEFPGDTITAV